MNTNKAHCNSHSHHPNVSGDLYCLDSLESDLTRHFDYIGTGYLMVSNYGVDMAVKSRSLSPQTLGLNGKLWWPESGVKVDSSQVEWVYAGSRSFLGAGIIECDFAKMPRGFSIVYLPKGYQADVFGLITETFAKSSIDSDVLRKQRIQQMPRFNCCPCCSKRADSIRQNTTQHPVFSILEMCADSGSECEFNVATEYVDMMSAWRMKSVSGHAGDITSIGDDHVLRVDAALIHTIQVVNTLKRGVPCSMLRCYHSLGGAMFEMAVEGGEHAGIWHKLCISGDSNYCAISECNSES